MRVVENFRSRGVEKKIEYVLGFLKIFRFLLWIAIIFFGLIAGIMLSSAVLLHFPLENSVGYTKEDFYWGIVILFSISINYFSLERIFKNIGNIFVSLKKNSLFNNENVKTAYKIVLCGIIYEFSVSFVSDIYVFIYKWDFSFTDLFGMFFGFLDSVPGVVALFAIVWLFDLGTQIQSEMDEVI